MSKVESPLESVIERKFCTWVKAQGGKTRKMNGMGFRSWPDRQCFKPRVRRSLFVELKRLGEPASLAQLECHRELRTLGQVVVICDTLEAAQEAYRAHR